MRADTQEQKMNFFSFSFALELAGWTFALPPP